MMCSLGNQYVVLLDVSIDRMTPGTKTEFQPFIQPNRFCNSSFTYSSTTPLSNPDHPSRSIENRALFDSGVSVGWTPKWSWTMRLALPAATTLSTL
jgi:hypothetical protein